MENEPMQHKKQNVSSSPSIFPPNSNSPQSTSSNPSQYPPTSGMPYPQHYESTTTEMGYPQPYVPHPGGQPYYPQPGPNYQAQQPQQQVVVVSTGVVPALFVGATSVSMVGAIVLSCFVFWCCGWLFGGIAFILAMVGQSSAAAGDTVGAIRLRNASIGLSIAGIVLTVIIIGIVAGVYGSAARYYQSYNSCRYYGSSNYYYCK